MTAATSSIDRREPFFEYRSCLAEEEREIPVVVRVPARNGRAVGVQNRLHEGEAFGQRGEDELAGVRHRNDGPGLHDQLRAISSEELGLESRVDACLPRELAVVIQAGMKRHVRVGDVVSDHRREELDVVAGVPRLLGECLDELRVDLLGAPGQRAVLVDELAAVLGDRLRLNVRQAGEGIRAVRVHVDEVMRRFLLAAGGAPQVRIDRVFDNRRSGSRRRRDGSPPAAAESPPSMMYLWPSKPHAAIGRGAARMSATIRPPVTLRMPPLYRWRRSLRGSDWMSATAVAAACADSATSHGSASLLRRLSGVSSFGVSSSIGSASNRAIVQQPAERLQPETALADVIVPIDPAAAWPLRVVQMKRPHPVQAHDPIELCERRRVALFRADVVASRQQMARVQTDTDTRGSVEILQDRLQDARTGVPGSFPDRRCVREGSSSSCRGRARRSPPMRPAISSRPSDSLPVV